MGETTVCTTPCYYYSSDNRSQRTIYCIPCCYIQDREVFHCNNGDHVETTKLCCIPFIGYLYMTFVNAMIVNTSYCICGWQYRTEQDNNKLYKSVTCGCCYKKNTQVNIGEFK